LLFMFCFVFLTLLFFLYIYCLHDVLHSNASERWDWIWILWMFTVHNGMSLKQTSCTNYSHSLRPPVCVATAGPIRGTTPIHSLHGRSCLSSVLKEQPRVQQTWRIFYELFTPIVSKFSWNEMLTL
jgi:hypothetical protein